MGIYLDNAATTFPKPAEVYAAVDRTFREIGVAPGRGSHRQGLAAARLLFAARDLLARVFNCADPARLVFTQSATEAINLALFGLLRAGDRVVTTTAEHNALARPLRVLEQRGVTVCRVPVDATGLLDPAALLAACQPGTRLVALAHCSNVTGTIQPLADFGPRLREQGILLLVDAAQSAGCLPLDVQASGIDLLAVPGHKGLYGPLGTGFLYVGPEVRLEPLVYGGTGSGSSDDAQPEALPERFESGTQNTPGIAGLLAGAEFVQRIGIPTIQAHEAALLEQLLQGLAALPGVVVHGPPPGVPRGPLVSCTVAGHDPVELGYRLDNEFDIAVRVGLHCAPEAHRAIGTYPAGTLRISPGWFTATDDIAAFLAAFRTILNA